MQRHTPSASQTLLRRKTTPESGFGWVLDVEMSMPLPPPRPFGLTSVSVPVPPPESPLRLPPCEFESAKLPLWPVLHAQTKTPLTSTDSPRRSLVIRAEVNQTAHGWSRHRVRVANGTDRVRGLWPSEGQANSVWAIALPGLGRGFGVTEYISILRRPSGVGC